MELTLSRQIAKHDCDLRLSPSDIGLPRCDDGVCRVITMCDSPDLLEGATGQPLNLGSDDRGPFLEVHRTRYVPPRPLTQYLSDAHLNYDWGTQST